MVSLWERTPMPAMNENERREQAFLALIRYAEADKQERADVYTVRNGGSHFHDMHRHPGKATQKGCSSASGAYQITFPTYNDLVNHGGPSDFSPHSQDELALQILSEAGALPLIWDGQLQGAFLMLNHKWNSLPGGTHQLITDKDAETYFWQKSGETPE